MYGLIHGTRSHRWLAVSAVLALILVLLPSVAQADDDAAPIPTWQPWSAESETDAVDEEPAPTTPSTTTAAPTEGTGDTEPTPTAPPVTASPATTAVPPTTATAAVDPVNADAAIRESAEADPANGALVAGSSIGVAAAADVVNNGDGTFAVMYLVIVENTGDEPLTDLSLSFDAASAFQQEGVVLDFTVDEVASTDLDVNFDVGPPVTGYNGLAELELLAAGQELPVGDRRTVVLALTVEPGGVFGPFAATFEGSATGTLAVSDESNAGSLTDTSDGASGPADGDPANDNEPTLVRFSEVPVITVAKQVGNLLAHADGTYTLTYVIEVANPGDVELSDVQVTDDLVAALVGARSFTVDEVRATSMTVNPGYDGRDETNLLIGTESLAPGLAEIIVIIVTVQPSSIREPFTNQAFASATSPSGMRISDASDSGTFGCSIAARQTRPGVTAHLATCTRPDPADTHPGEPGDTGTADDPTVTELPANPRIGVAKEVVEVVNNQDGTHDILFRVRVKNAGDVQLGSLQLTDDLEAIMLGTPFEILSIANAAAPGLVTLSPNPAFTGSFDKNLLVGNDTLEPGETGGIDVRMRITPSDNYGPFLNVVIGNGTDPAGTVVGDLSDAGFDADPDAVNDGAPGDTGGTDDPTPMQIPVPQFDLRLEKSGVAEPNGVIWSIRLSNLGPDAAPGPIVVTDVLPAGMTLQDSTVPEGWLCRSEGQAFICVWESAFPANAVAEFELTTAVNANGSWSNSVTVSTPIDSDFATTDDAATDQVIVGNLPVTGSTTSTVVLFGLALLLTGAAVLAGPRRELA